MANGSVVSLVDESHDQVRDLAIAATTADSVEEAEALAVRLADVLTRHFDAEESSGGLFDWLGRAAIPGRVVERLRRQHGALRGELPAVVEGLEGRAPDATTALHRFVRHFLHHEWLERSAVVRAMSGPRDRPLTVPVCEEDLEMQELATDVVRRIEALGTIPRAIELVAPGDAEHAESQASRLEVCLGDAGIEFVEVHGQPGEVLAVRSMAFEGPPG